MSSPGGKDLWPSTRFTQETEGKNFLGLAYGRERLEQFLYRNVLMAVTVQEFVLIFLTKLSHLYYRLKSVLGSIL